MTVVLSESAAIPNEPLSAAASLDVSLSFPYNSDFVEPMDLGVGFETSAHAPALPSVAQTAGPSESGGPRLGFTCGTKCQRFKPSNLEPWLPFFKSRQDFVLAELIMEVEMNQGQIKCLLKLFEECLKDKRPITLSSHLDIRGAWERASAQLTPFEYKTISVPYGSVDHEFTVPHRPLWNWANDLILDAQLAPHFEWDAQKVFKHDGENTTRVYDEPWTANVFWDIQSQIPVGARLLCFILYADKAKLSSFGTAKSYPVIACCVNLPAEIRNSNGVGGGRVVGWLPIIQEPPAHTGKPTFINFKHEVWHHAFHCVIKSLIEPSKTGCWLNGIDGKPNLYYPAITMSSADYEEQCIMALNRGTGGKWPCLVCFITKEKLSDFSKRWEKRTVLDTQQKLLHARGLNKGTSNAYLSEFGIRDVDNVFWLVNNLDPYRALSFDRLHSNNSGLFGYHMWRNFKALVNEIGRDAAAKVDQQFGLIPYGAKYEDISKVVVFVAQNIIPQDNQEGRQLLLCLRSFSFLDLLLSFKVHTEQTILAGQKEIKQFGSYIWEYAGLTLTSLDSDVLSDADDSDPDKDKDKDKNWNFPKLHALLHSFDDVLAKGASRNYNTKPNEKMHGPMKKYYLNRMNFKNVAPQILKFEHTTFIAALIRAQIDQVDANMWKQKTDSDDSDDEDDKQHARL
ncbi:hypothetical protein EI94DRAFT_1806512 [Lactarius quietus]|nr:hypothetical protein EI94DRAFT_1806512 [Lactarius quietus]